MCFIKVSSFFDTYNQKRVNFLLRIVCCLKHPFHSEGTIFYASYQHICRSLPKKSIVKLIYILIFFMYFEKCIYCEKKRGAPKEMSILSLTKRNPTISKLSQTHATVGFKAWFFTQTYHVGRLILVLNR